MQNPSRRGFQHAAIFSALLIAFGASAQNAPQSNTIGNGGGSIDQQIIGDTSTTADRTNSVSNQLGNSANANGAQLGVTNDTRDQNTVTSTGGAATGGAAHGNLSDNDNKSSASNGNMSSDNKSSVGNTSSNSGGNNLSNGGNTTGGNTMVGGSNAAAGGAGGQGGSSSSNGTNAQGQQQGIAGSGNSTNTVKGGDQSNTSKNTNSNGQGQGQGQGQQQANNGTNAQGQTSANTNVAGGNSGGNSANRNSQSTAQNTNAGNGAGAGAGSGNRTSNTTGVAVDASDRSVTENNTKIDARSLYIPSVVPATPPSIVASASVVTAGMACGPMQQIVRTPVNGTFHGYFFDSETPQGWTDDLAPYMELDGRPYKIVAGQEVDPRAVVVPYVYFNNDKTKPFGQQIVMHSSVVGTSGARNLALGGGGGGNMNWGQAGGGASSGTQRMVTTIQLRLCAIEVAAPVVITPPPARTELPVVSKVGE